ncbi:unnamed protein product [Caenorhabditis angaria]|uniref:Uncharacterized protein n=1 Tax=Caenorhabditis angaria TaxID=860376 RepID=A0A9P1MZI7_9PELO|nr:unnamed protein product [Caenorhabditis angaria]
MNSGGNGEEEEDVGIGVEMDFDQCSEEATYYTQCANLREKTGEKGDFERVDSAVSLTSPRDAFPAKLQKLNGSRKINEKRTFEESAVKRTIGFKKEMQKQSKTTDSYLLSHQRLATHLIDFIDVPMNKNLRRRLDLDKVKIPLFSMSETGLDICSDYFFPMESPFSKIEMSYLRTLSENLSKSHRKLKEIVEFVDMIGEKSRVTIPMLIRVFYEWAVEFLRDHTFRLDELRSKRLVDPFQVLANLKPICEEIDLVRIIIGEDSIRQFWMWEGIEMSWNRVFLITQKHATIQKNTRLMRNLQEKWVQTLLQTMDHIFESGRVPLESRHFVLHK